MDRPRNDGTLTRRHLLAGAAALGATVGGAVLLRAPGRAVGDGLQSPPVQPFQRDLPIPRAATPVHSDAIADYYEIRQRRANLEILPGLSTQVWAYDGEVPGPTIMAREGRAVVVTHFNDLVDDGVHTAVHTHGALVDGDSDGHPNDHVAPGSSLVYAFPNATFGPRAEQTARTMWYHDHFMHETGRNVYNGLAGFYLLDDESEASRVLPRGEFDVPLMITDRYFNADGSFNFPFQDGEDFQDGLEGDVMIVNGAVQPRFGVATRRYRLRLLNACSARVLDLSFDNRMPFQIVATEGGFARAPITTTSVVIAPAERYEIIVDFAGVALNKSLVLRNRLGSGRTSSVMRFDVVRQTTDDSFVPAQLRTIERIPTTEAVVTRRFEFARKGGQYTINDKVYDEKRFLATPRSGTTEIWKLKNGGGGWTHPIHPHLTNFQVLSRDRVALRPYEKDVWKETVFLPENATATVITTWPDVPPDVLGRAARAFRDRYVFHCHNMQHEDDDMMAQMRILPA